MNNTAKCTNCGLDSPVMGGHPDDDPFFQGGLIVSEVEIGYYGGFTDGFGDDKSADLCHDCSLLLMRTMSGLAKYLLPNRGGHPCSTEIPCCEYAWSFRTDENGETIVVLGTTEGTWELSQTS